MNDPKTLIEFMEIYKSEEDCRKALFEHRWPDGFRCPRCDHGRAYAHKKRPLFECAACGHQASATAGTILEGTRTDLRKWFLAIYLLAATKKPFSSAELARQLNVAAAVAWTMRRKITRAMTRREGELMLLGVVEMDESYVGGAHKGKRGRGSAGKTPVAVMAQQNESGGLDLAHMQVLEGISGLSLGEVAQATIAGGLSSPRMASASTGRWPVSDISMSPWLWEQMGTPPSCFPGCISPSPTSSAGSWMSFTVLAPSIYSPILMSSVTGSTVEASGPISFAAF